MFRWVKKLAGSLSGKNRRAAGQIEVDFSDGFEWWAKVPLERINPKEIGHGILICDEYAARMMAGEHYDVAYRARMRALELQRYASSQALQNPRWTTEFTQRQLLQAAVCCSRIGEAKEEADLQGACRWWKRGLALIEEAIVLSPKLPDGTAALQQKLTMELALGCMESAALAKSSGDLSVAGQNYAAASELWLAVLTRPVGEVPDWVIHKHQQTLRLTAATAKELAAQLEDDPERRVALAERSIKYYDELYRRYPEQPEPVAKALMMARQMLALLRQV